MIVLLHRRFLLRNKRCLFFLFVFSFLADATYANQTIRKDSITRHFSVSALYTNGNVTPLNSFVQGDNLLGKPIRHHQSFGIKMLWQSPGNKNWQKIYQIPYYGLGISGSDFHNPRELGNPISIYGILGIPVLRMNRLEVYSEIQWGLAGLWKHYDPVSNPKNNSIGGMFTFHFGLGLNVFYPLSKKIDLGAGLAFIHFSNGALVRPNRGIDIIGPTVEVKYRFGERPYTHKPSITIPALPRYNDLFFMLGFGRFQLPEQEYSSIFHNQYGLGIVYFIQLSNAIRLGFGTDLNISTGNIPVNEASLSHRFSDRLSLGLMIQPELIFDRLTLSGAMGIYALHGRFGSFKKFYQRMGIRYDLYRNISVGLNIRAICPDTMYLEPGPGETYGRFDLFDGDFFEFSLGYKLRWKQKSKHQGT